MIVQKKLFPEMNFISELSFGVFKKMIVHFKRQMIVQNEVHSDKKFILMVHNHCHYHYQNMENERISGFRSRLKINDVSVKSLV